MYMEEKIVSENKYLSKETNAINKDLNIKDIEEYQKTTKKSIIKCEFSKNT